MSRRLINPGVETLSRLYIEEQKTAKDIAGIYHVDPQTVTRWLNAAGIPLRRVCRHTVHPELTREVLEELYQERGLSCEEIAELYGLSPQTVHSKIYMEGIKRKETRYKGKRAIPSPDEDTLHRLYEEQYLTMAAIAKKYGVSIETVRKWLDKAGIPRRQKGRPNSNLPAKVSKNPGKEELYRLRVEEGKTVDEIARICGVTYNCASVWLSRAGIHQEAGKRDAFSDKFPGRENLRHMYLDEMLSVHDIARMCGVSRPAVYSWLGASGIDRKARSAARPGKEILYMLHVTDGLDPAEIAGKYGVSEETVSLWLMLSGVKQDVPPEKPDDKKLRQLYEKERKTIPEIAKEYNVSIQAVRRWLSQAGVHVRENGSFRPEKKELEQLYSEQLMSVRRIAEQYGVSEASVNRWIRYYGIPLHGHKGAIQDSKNPGKETLQRLYIEEGKTAKEIAEMYGVHIQTVHNWAYNAGLIKREQKGDGIDEEK